MSIYDRLAAVAQHTDLHEEETSYFSTPEKTLDPRLFKGTQLRERVRSGVLSVLYGFWGPRYAHPHAWSRVWLAGSGVSYQWSAARNPGDLDCLIGVDFVGFRRSNPDFAQLSDTEIATYLNRQLHDDLWPRTARWNGYELTFYVNPESYDITNIHPYAAYSLTDDAWTVEPDKAPHPEVMPEWNHVVANDTAQARIIIDRYNKALDEVDTSHDPGGRLNSSITLRAAAREGAMLFDSIHEGRKKAFSKTGGGYNDLNEFRYKSAKGSGVLSALRVLKEELVEAGLEDEAGTYGYSFPDAREAILQAALGRRFKR